MRATSPSGREAWRSYAPTQANARRRGPLEQSVRKAPATRSPGATARRTYDPSADHAHLAHARPASARRAHERRDAPLCFASSPNRIGRLHLLIQVVIPTHNVEGLSGRPNRTPLSAAVWSRNSDNGKPTTQSQSASCVGLECMATLAVATAFARIVAKRYPGTSWLPIESSRSDDRFVVPAGKVIRLLSGPADMDASGGIGHPATPTAYGRASHEHGADSGSQ